MKTPEQNNPNDREDKRTNTDPTDVNDPSVQKTTPKKNQENENEDEGATPGEDTIDDTNAA